MMKKALLVISFGTSYPEALEKNIVACEQTLAAAHPDRDCFRAFTSYMIIKKLARRDNLHINNPQQALQALYEQGYDDVLVQSLHIINGDEYEKVATQVNAYQDKFTRLDFGQPLLTSHADYEQLITALEHQCPTLQSDERLVLMGHGTTHYTFSTYACLDHMLTAKGSPMMVGAVESYPEIDTLIDRLKAQNVKKAYLMPLMLVAGDHAINDMASDEEDSWKTQLIEAGIEAMPIVQGLGENPLIRDMFVQHLADAITDAQEAA
ncbi:sirohydrochlorin cobaltochelatase [Vibrio nitrifigilis]|nr:sirohydrochlorin cobaltochelatase [Vibrio nitrifigilis]